MSFIPRLLLFGLFIALLSVSHFSASTCADETKGADIPLTKDCNVRLASVKQGRQALGKRDAFIEAMSPYDRQARLRSSEPVSTDQFLAHVEKQVLPWQDSDAERLHGSLARLRPLLEPWNLALPKTISLVKTTGREESGAAYCRGAAVVLPSTMLSYNERRLDRLLTHELFHVLSNQNPKLRRRMYAILGFQPCGAVQLPEELKGRKLTNPDAPLVEDMITLDQNGEKVQAAPVLFSAREKYAPGRSFFSDLTFRLMVIERRAAHWEAKMADGKPFLLDARQSQSYFQQIGRNTDYIIHPEEILAENFVHLIHGKSDLPSPRIVDALAKCLREPTAAAP